MNFRKPLVTGLLLPICATLALGQVADKRLKDRDPEIRQKAIEELTVEGGERAGEYLVRALDDKDWGVVLAAIKGLAVHGERGAIKDLVDLSMNAPLLLMREEAARSLARMAGDEGAKNLMKKMGAKTRLEALQALAVVAGEGVLPESVAMFPKFLKNKDEALHPVAARAWLACAPSEEKPAVLATLLDSERLLVRSEAAEALIHAPDAGCVLPLVEALAGRQWNSVVERRLVRALVACVGVGGEGDALQTTVTMVVEPKLAQDKEGGALYARFLEEGLRGAKPVLSQDFVLERLAEVFTKKGASTRAQAYHTLGAVGTEAARDLAIERMEKEDSPRCIEPLVRALIALGGLEQSKGIAAVAKCLSDARGREGGLESLCVALSRPEIEAETLVAVEKALIDTLETAKWEVAVTAAVALGKAQGPKAMGMLQKYASKPDWRHRGAAAVGLMHLGTPEAFDQLLEMRSDENASVAISAQRALQRLAGREGQGEPPMGWTEWWAENRAKANLRQHAKSLRSHEKYGYTVPDSLIYSGLDVVVIPGRGDRIEEVLERLNIHYRVVRAGKVAEAGLHPTAVLMVGCTGELHPKDIEVVQWYVRCGGALFTSCWSLTHTADRAFPGHMRQFRTEGEVMDRVSTRPAQASSPLLNGVFAEGCVPIYELVGAHLIQVLDPLRTQVLIDSPEAADRHGSGEMAAWFWSGHGTVLDSVNHFDLQGLEMANHLKKPADLQAYAINHMGLSIEKLRRTIKEKWWKKRMEAAQQVDDLSAFRLLTNFVREKRLRGD